MLGTCRSRERTEALQPAPGWQEILQGEFVHSRHLAEPSGELHTVGGVWRGLLVLSDLGAVFLERWGAAPLGGLVSVKVLMPNVADIFPKTSLVCVSSQGPCFL